MIAITTSNSTSVNARRTPVSQRAKFLSTTRFGILTFMPCSDPSFLRKSKTIFGVVSELLVANAGHGTQVRRNVMRTARALLLVSNYLLKFPIDTRVMDE